MINAAHRLLCGRESPVDPGNSPPPGQASHDASATDRKRSLVRSHCPGDANRVDSGRETLRITIPLSGTDPRNGSKAASFQPRFVPPTRCSLLELQNSLNLQCKVIVSPAHWRLSMGFKPITDDNISNFPGTAARNADISCVVLAAFFNEGLTFWYISLAVRQTRRICRRGKSR